MSVPLPSLSALNRDRGRSSPIGPDAATIGVTVFVPTSHSAHAAGHHHGPIPVAEDGQRAIPHQVFFAVPAFVRLLAIVAVLIAGEALGHGVADDDKSFIEQNSGVQLLPYIYLGAKHMVTGYDHLLFLFGVIFFLYRLREVATYVTMFAIGHSVTLLYGVLSGTHVNPYIVDAIIGVSVVYKALDNIDAFKRVLGYQPNAKMAVLIFGFFHGFGLATKLQEFELAEDGLVPNILAFNVGVELGQFMALGAILIAIGFWRRTPSFGRQAFTANVMLMTAGFVLIGYQLTGYFVAQTGS